MKFLKLFSLSLFFLLGTFFLQGCGQKSAQVLDTDAHGYQCSQCKLKFYTDSTVWADFCPGCKASGPSAVSKLTCPKDGYSWILDSGNMNCQKCGQKVESFGLPRSSELLAWGAVKKTQKDVSTK